MLKSLELFGFKSFADRTKFDFATGITCVVGPNGSGKSNVVDAIKWILGDQSPKSLRGKEMSDVIFNGSAGRKASGFAEATLTFDNSGRILPIDSQEVQVGRRLWQGGDAEYLINNTPSRLKDVRDLFMGTGTSTGAYSIIEQGRVDQILQANASARRMVFEEAAGISRFKSRKTDALRKLDRVAQNLLRLTDIVDEVESQLNSTRSQAVKAAKYREVSEELRAWWLGLAADDYRQLSARLEQSEQQVERDKRIADELNEQLQGYEAQLSSFEVEAAEVDDQLRQVERTSAANREAIVDFQSTIRHQSDRRREIGTELVRLRKQRSVMNQRLNQIEGELKQTSRDLESFEREFTEQQQELNSWQERIDGLVADNTSRQEQIEQGRSRMLELVQRISQLSNRAETLESQIAIATSSIEHAESQTKEIEQRIAECRAKHSQAEAKFEEAKNQAALLDNRILEARNERNTSQQELDDSLARLASMREQRTGWQARLAVLEDLESRQEGLGIGAKEILSRARTSQYPPWNRIVGSVADLIETDVEHAALLEVALGSRSQLIVLDELGPLIEYINSEQCQISGRVGFVATSQDGEQSAEAEPERAEVNLTGEPGVVMRADKLVAEASAAPELAEQLLGDTWVVETLDAARALSARHGQSCRFVTLQGEVLDSGDTLFVGAIHRETAIVSRKSELRRLKNDLQRHERKIAEEELTSDRLKQTFQTAESQLNEIMAEKIQQADELSRLEADWKQQTEQLAKLEDDKSQVAQEETCLQAQQTELQAERDTAQMQQATIDEERISLQATIEEDEREVLRHQHRLRTISERHQDEKLSFAKKEERLSGLRVEHQRLQEELQQRQMQRDEAHRRLQAALEKRRQTVLQILNATAILSEKHLVQEGLAREIALVMEQKAEVRNRKSQLAAEESKIRQQRRQVSEQQHSEEIRGRDIRHQIATLEERIEEEYQLVLSDVVASGESALALFIAERQRDNSAVKDESPLEVEEAAFEDSDSAVIETVESDDKVIDAEPSTDEEDSGDSSIDDPAYQFEELRGELESRVNRLRRKLKTMGNVNTDSLSDLDELETRYKRLSEQLQDLEEAKATLEEIVRKINVESKRLFTESYESIRVHFQELFRKLFGGGEGDIILEDPNDVLECGIDIVARPPGKELRSISLLSGGEKTMTAVALLLAIFRSRPSPFCILDEVDAALDEANIERFTAVVKDFQTKTQFIMITHSKRSMTVGDVLYGVTMEQSGVSKRMSVKFEDVSENGEFTTSRSPSGADGENPVSDAA